MSTTIRRGPEHTGAEECVICGKIAAHHSSQRQEFAYRDGQREVILMADVPVVHCTACAESYTAEGAEEAQHEAVCRYLGRLTPAEIRALRDRFGISQAKLAELTHIGIASIKRWEGGTHIQNASLDARLRALDGERAEEIPMRAGFHFRFPPKPEAREASRRWQLRPDYSSLYAATLEAA